ncbi:MAG: hypothetical protein NW215_03760 [Hyphomicrobiales bacterium]|nr:hypothetical protein [Hyphomicrobiales bacterium]
MVDAVRFHYTTVRNALSETAVRPILPLTLSYRDTRIEAQGLLDTGADVNVLPYALGLSLGGDWDQARTGLRLSGNLAQYEARGILLNCIIGNLAPVQLAFAWTRAENVPLLFGQVNFFAEFNVCFFRSTNSFEVRPKLIP